MSPEIQSRYIHTRVASFGLSMSWLYTFITHWFKLSLVNLRLTYQQPRLTYNLFRVSNLSSVFLVCLRSDGWSVRAGRRNERELKQKEENPTPTTTQRRSGRTRAPTFFSGLQFCTELKILIHYQPIIHRVLFTVFYSPCFLLLDNQSVCLTLS